MRVEGPAKLLTPPQIAKQLGVRADRVVGWIRSGELIGVNLADRASTRPRFRVSPTDLSLFLEARRAIPVPKVRPSRRKKSEGVIEFF